MCPLAWFTSDGVMRLHLSQCTSNGICNDSTKSYHFYERNECVSFIPYCNLDCGRGNNSWQVAIMRRNSTFTITVPVVLLFTTMMITRLLVPMNGTQTHPISKIYPIASFTGPKIKSYIVATSSILNVLEGVAKLLKTAYLQ